MNIKSGLVILMLSMADSAFSEDYVYSIKINNHLFYPDTLIVPSGIRFKLILENEDDSPEEFESYELNREKVIMGNTKVTVFIGPLKPDTYPFFGEFNPEVARGKIIARPLAQD